MPTRPDLAPEPWQPTFPNQAAGNRDLYQPRDQDAPGSGTPTPYEPAPATSHLHGWRALTSSFFRTFVAEANGFPRGTALLQVAFTPRKGVKGVGSEYYYGFATPAEAEAWAARLRNAAHPGEHIPDIQAACIAYRRSR